MDIAKFKEWLSQRGCEILPTTNQYETLRIKGKEIGILYNTGKTNGSFMNIAIQAFKAGKKWDGSPIKTGRHAGYRKEKAQLIERDGTRCFYCGQEMEEDITIEHLIALSCGGKNSLSNMVLAHQKCNQDAHNLPVSEKVKIAINNRTLKQAL